jgi:hypothetical protein
MFSNFWTCKFEGIEVDIGVEKDLCLLRRYAEWTGQHLATFCGVHCLCLLGLVGPEDGQYGPPKCGKLFTTRHSAKAQNT